MVINKSEVGVIGDHHEVISRQQDADNNISLGSIINAIPRFKKIETCSFFAEHAMKDGALVIHFFPTPATSKLNWEVSFPQTLDRVAREYFKAEYPRLRAKYTEELNSWWFQANGYEHLIDLDAFIRGFFVALDSAISDAARC